MALGIHWEWRGFGAVSSDFVYRFCNLAPAYPDIGDEAEVLQDEYLWAPGLDVNVKFRPDVPTEPFKFKSLVDTEGVLEKWAERPEDIFDFPLAERGWEILRERFGAADVPVGPYPAAGADLETTLARLLEAGVQQVSVGKSRFCALWRGRVRVEWACIRSPQAVLSIGLETWLEEENRPAPPDARARADLRAAIEDLGLDHEPLRAMNYLDAVSVWAQGSKI